MQLKNKYLILILFPLYFLANSTGIFSQETNHHRTHSFFAYIPEKNKTPFLKTNSGSNKRPDSAYSNIDYPGNFQLKKDIRVFGWHVSWLGNSYHHYNYSLLTHIAYFGCNIDPTGGIRSFNGWDTTNFVSYVKSQKPQCKVLLTAACFGKSVDTLLKNSSSQESLIQKLSEAVTEKKADGICIDFEEISGENRDRFSAFITKLSLNFRQQNLIVSLTLPAVDSARSFDVGVLSRSVDFYILTGYDYFGSFSRFSGPVAPLVTKTGWINNSIEASVNYYLENKVNPSSLLLGVPYFGALWETKDSAIPSRTTSFLGYRPYNHDLSMLKKLRHDTLLKVSYFNYHEQNKNLYRQFWLDDVYSLGTKYDFVLQKKLGGIGIWALGFDSGSNDLWELLKIKFSTGTVNLSSSAEEKTTEVTPNSFTLITEHPVLVGIGAVLGLALLFVLFKFFWFR